jgi:hypothetical protein
MAKTRRNAMVGLFDPNTQTRPAMPVPPASQAAPARQRCAPAGEFIFTPEDLGRQPYLLVDGEVVVLRDGQIVDLVESGELVDPALWPGAVAIAWHTSFLQPLRQEML